MWLSHCFFFSIFQLGLVNIEAIFNECQTKGDCGECISSSPECSWCEDIYYNSTSFSFYKKCDLVGNHNTQQCGAVNNPPSTYNIDKSTDLVGENRVSPQEVSVKLRPGQATSVDIKIKTPVNFPIDLYYLMDLSASMKDDLSQIRTLGEKLSGEMKDITTNFRLGFGGYVDKPLGPYTFVYEPEIRKKTNTGAQYTFAYKNYLPLSEDTSLFGKTLDNVVQISFNIDEPEGALEALMQVATCHRDIGWRDKQKARRIVIITTDATFHFAGDGLLGGTVLPNDAACHLVDGNYTAWNRFDYPSLSQIRSVMIDNEIVPIFATTGNNELYQKVTDFFGAGSGAVADKLSNDSSNVVPLIKEAYEKIAKIVRVRTGPGLPSGITVNYAANCDASGYSDFTKEAYCDNVAIGQEVTFKAELMATSCDQAGDKNLQFKIATNFDDVLVNVELICDCECNETDVDSMHCSSRGNLTCGQCACDPAQYAGRFCQCTLEEAKNETLCRQEGKTGPVCSGKGDCSCGECECRQPAPNKLGEIEFIYGRYCDCSNTSCGRSNGGQICGGPDRGSCDCGQCACKPSWQGPRCGERCLDGQDQCEDFYGEICSGKGTCKCNKCQCNEGYAGDQCQECIAVSSLRAFTGKGLEQDNDVPQEKGTSQDVNVKNQNCPDPCQDYRECVKCRVFETSDLSFEECIAECAKWNVTSHIIVEKVPEERRCIARDEDDCSFVFTFKKDNVTEEVQLIVQKDRICPAEPDILAIILGVIAGIVGIGLALLLIWKLLATIQDRREFANFEKDRENPKWDSGENPIYQKATSTFQNPMYGNNQPEPEATETDNLM